MWAKCQLSAAAYLIRYHQRMPLLLQHRVVVSRGMFLESLTKGKGFAAFAQVVAGDKTLDRWYAGYGEMEGACDLHKSGGWACNGMNSALSPVHHFLISSTEAATAVVCTVVTLLLSKPTDTQGFILI
jgi:hypothetical protein